MLSLKHGSKVGGCFVIQHQTEETMATILLAWQGEDSKVLRRSISASDTKTSLSLSEEHKCESVSCHFSGEGVCVPVR